MRDAWRDRVRSIGVRTAPRIAGKKSAIRRQDRLAGGMPMTRDTHAINLDDDPLVPLAIRIPASQYQVLRDYCRYRGHDPRKIPLAAAGAIAAFFERERVFQDWLREHPDPAPEPTPAASQGVPGRRGRRRRTASNDTPDTGR